MKALIGLFILSLSLSAFSSERLLKKCGPLAEKVTQEEAGGGYDKDGFSAYECELAPNKAVVICELGASKGDGAATDTFRTVLNKSCTRVLRIDLLREE